MPHKDPVTEAVYDEVMSRDIIQRWRNLLNWFEVDLNDLHEVMEMYRQAQKEPCVARTVDPLDSGPCGGRLTLDHVHRHAGGTFGKRAPSDPQHLVVLCALHHLGEGDKGGRVWARANKPKLRWYLDAIYGEEVDETKGRGKVGPTH
jgi:hypothetical protein